MKPDLANGALLAVEDQAHKVLWRHVIEREPHPALKAKPVVKSWTAQQDAPLHALAAQHLEPSADEGSADALALPGREDGDGAEADPLARAGRGDCYRGEGDMTDDCGRGFLLAIGVGFGVDGHKGEGDAVCAAEGGDYVCLEGGWECGAGEGVDLGGVGGRFGADLDGHYDVRRWDVV